MEGGVTVSYSGVHQAYQIALAATEIGRLDRFYCSLFDAPGKWGRRFAKILGSDALGNRRLDGLDPARVIECPWFELQYKLRSRLMRLPGNAWITAAQQFDRWVAPRLQESRSRVFVAAENCAFASFQVAKKHGMTCIYDCPGYEAPLLAETTRAAADLLGLKYVGVADTDQIQDRKRTERDLADVVLACSTAHAESLTHGGIPASKLRVIPLWIDVEKWFPTGKSPEQKGRLRVLYAGNISLRKGVPFLLRAIDGCEGAAELTLIGQINEDMRRFFAPPPKFVEVREPVPKVRLREIYGQYDVLVLPSLGDSFGFVALEAMACGLPVVVTQNCGVPVPDATWRVPVMNADAIATRLAHYAANREALAADSALAVAHAREYSPQRYRDGIAEVLRAYLPGSNR